MLPVKFDSIWASGFRGKKILKYLPIRKNNITRWSYLLSEQDEIRKVCKFLPTEDPDCQVYMVPFRQAVQRGEESFI